MAIAVLPGAESHVSLRIGCYILFGASTCVLFTRIYFRILSIGLDDIFVIFAWFCNVASIVAVKFMFEQGIGYHASDIIDQTLIPKSVLWPWTTQFLYYFGVSAVKTSVVALYLRLASPGTQTTVLRIALCVLVLQGLASGVTVAGFLCHPIDLAWKGGIGGPHCINILAFNYYNAAFHILTDILLAILPIPVIRRLQLDKTTKVNLSIMFGLGSLVIGATIARQVTNAFALEKVSDFTWFWAAAELCTILELSLGIIFCSLPAIRPLFARWLPAMNPIKDRSAKKDGAYRLDDDSYKNGQSDLVTIGKMSNHKLRPMDSILLETRMDEVDEGGSEAGQERDGSSHSSGRRILSHQAGS